MEINIVLTTTPTLMQTITIYESPKEYTPFNTDTILINCIARAVTCFIRIIKITCLDLSKLTNLVTHGKSKLP